MGTNTTGSLVKGTIEGLGKDGVNGIAQITAVEGNPSGLLCVPQPSGLAYDRTNGIFYMGKDASDQEWIQLGSTAFS